MLRKKQKGFTLIEMVLYIGILTLLLGVMSAILGSIVSVQLESTSTSSVDQDGRYILEKFTRDVASSSAILIPVNPGIQTNTFQITINSINYTYSIDSNNNLQVINNSTNEINVLNSYDTTVSSLTFTRIGSGTNNDTIQITYVVTSRNKEKAGQQEVKSFTTTVGNE